MCFQQFINLYRHHVEQFDNLRGAKNDVATQDVENIVSYSYSVYTRIYFIAQRHKNQIQSLQMHQVEQTVEMARCKKLVHSAVSFFYVYILLLACYLPFLICLRIEHPSVTIKIFWVVSLTLLFLNSSLNPLIYCWRTRNMRHSILNALRNMSRNQNRISHS